MDKNKTSTRSNALIWFGAGVSIAEIMTGVSVASLGFIKGTLAIVIGHVIGCVLLFLVGLIGGIRDKSSMDTVKIFFGEKGSVLFSLLNIIQLVGWTSIMIVNGAAVANLIYPAGQWVWSIVIGLLISLWLVTGTKNFYKLNIVAMSTLFALSVLLSVVIFAGDAGKYIADNTMSFGAAVELSVAMPLSWVPLISDYTSRAKKPVAASLASSVTYFFTSCWMYIIGMSAAMFTGEKDVGLILLKSGLGLYAFIIVIFSTVTTTFLDVFSAGVSCKSVFSRINEKYTALIVTILGTFMAIFLNVNNFESFLYFIGSVFAPMIAIQITEQFILKNNYDKSQFNWRNLVIWFVGFMLYRLFMGIDTMVGYTLPAMFVVGLICVIVHEIKQKSGR